MIFLYVETPLHAGAGSGLGAIDLPIQRERFTAYPLVQSGGVKGALREAAGIENDEKWAVFGLDPQTMNEKRGEEYAGAAGFGDARILLFPIRSLKGVFAWTTSLNVLHRWQREAADISGLNLPELPHDEPPFQGDTSFCWAGPGVTLPASGGVPKAVVLEEFTFQVDDSPKGSDGKLLLEKLAAWLAEKALPESLSDYWEKQLKQKLVILRDEDFCDLVQHATEVLTRVRLEPGIKTVASGALWTEEHLPADTMLYVPVRATRLRMPKVIAPVRLRNNDPNQEAQNVLDWLAARVNGRLQLGGDETVGRGLASLRWQPPPPKTKKNNEE